ncbi:hypothetical protein Tco_0123774 [Tanacetum coccineum]
MVCRVRSVFGLICSALVKTNSRGVYDLDEDVSEVTVDENNVDMDQFFQENERVICTTSENNDIQPFNLVHGDIEEVAIDLDDDVEEDEFEDIASGENDDTKLIYEEDEFDYIVNSVQIRLEDHLTDDDGIKGTESGVEISHAVRGSSILNRLPAPGDRPMIDLYADEFGDQTAIGRAITEILHFRSIRHELVAPPSSDYISGPEEPHTPPVPQDEGECEPMFIQPHDPNYVPEPMYHEYIPLEDEHVCPAEEHPLPLVVSPTIESPGYVVESDPEEDPEEYEDDETEDGPVDYPMDGIIIYY